MTPHTVWIGGPPAAHWFDPNYTPPKSSKATYIPPAPKEQSAQQPKKARAPSNAVQLIMGHVREKGFVISADVVAMFGIKRNAASVRLNALVAEGRLAIASGGKATIGQRGNTSAIYVLGERA